VSPESLAQRAYRELRNAIIDGRIAPGETVLEAEVGTMLRMSRTPVREALRHLELEGYIVRDAASRLVVNRPTPTDVTEIFVVRELLEGDAVRLAASRISDDELARLEELIAADRRALRRRRFDELASLNDEIHSVIMAASRNRTLSELLGNLRGRVLGLNAFAVGTDDDQRQFVDEHAAIVELLRDGDGDAAVALLHGHLGRARDVLLRGLQGGDAP
jgi:DNA-binding GntR family transcriptional regulator